MPWVQASGKLQKVQGQLNEKKPCLLAFREEFLSLYLPVIRIQDTAESCWLRGYHWIFYVLSQHFHSMRCWEDSRGSCPHAA